MIIRWALSVITLPLLARQLWSGIAAMAFTVGCGGLLIRRNFPLDAEYQFSVKLLRNIVGYMTGLEWPHQLEITVDGERKQLVTLGGGGRGGRGGGAPPQYRVAIKAGPHLLGLRLFEIRVDVGIPRHDLHDRLT